MIGDNVATASLGGDLFEDIQGDVDDELAYTCAVDDIFVPGTSSSISDDNKP